MTPPGEAVKNGWSALTGDCGSGTVAGSGPGCPHRCRVCLEGVANGDLEACGALRLGCRCSAGLDVLHAACAERWFRARCLRVAGCACCRCEVCGGVAAGLPESFKKELLEMSSRVACQPDVVPEPRSGPVRFQRTPGVVTGPHRCCSCCCALPATAALFSLAVMYTAFLHMKVLPAVIISSIVATTMMLHWIMVPVRPLAHILVVLWFLLSIMWITSMLVKLQSWDPVQASLFGVLAGALFAGGTYSLVESVFGSPSCMFLRAQHLA